MRPANRSSRAVTTAVAAIALVALTACAVAPKQDPRSANTQPEVVKRERGVPDERPSLAVGDVAPAIDIEHYIKGDGIDRFERGRVYVLEFWATWCGPCRASIPHLSKLQQEYEDQEMVVIGVSREPLDVVVAFLKKTNRNGRPWSDEIAYTLTADPDGSVNNDYMRAAGRRGIPTAFIIGKDGRIEWIGHPMRMDDVLEAVLSGEWDRASATPASVSKKS